MNNVAKMDAYYPQPTWPRVVSAFALASALATMVGCGSKPPGCADAETIALAASIVSDEVGDAYAKLSEGFQRLGIQSLLAPLNDAAARYRTGLKIELKDVVTNGYSADAKRHSCSGSFVVTTLTGQVITAPQDFTSQATADGKGRFVVQIPNLDPLIVSLGSDMGDFLHAARLDLAQREERASAHAEPPVAGIGGSPGMGRGIYKKEEGVVEVDVTGNQMAFNIRTSIGQHSCDLTGTARFTDTLTAKYNRPSQSDVCDVTFRFSGGRLAVETSQCNERCGMQAADSMDGTYVR